MSRLTMSILTFACILTPAWFQQFTMSQAVPLPAKNSSGFDITDMVQSVFNDDATKFFSEQQLKRIWNETLARHSPSNIRITIRKYDDIPNSIWQVMTYSITGDSKTPVDVKEAIAAFHQALTLDDVLKGRIVASNSTSSNRTISGDTSTAFRLIDSVQLNYHNPAWMDEVMPKLALLWGKVLGVPVTQQISLDILREEPVLVGGPGNVNRTPIPGYSLFDVLYLVSGHSAVPVDALYAKQAFRDALAGSNIDIGGPGSKVVFFHDIVIINEPSA